MRDGESGVKIDFFELLRVVYEIIFDKFLSIGKFNLRTVILGSAISVLAFFLILFIQSSVIQAYAITPVSMLGPLTSAQFLAVALCSIANIPIDLAFLKLSALVLSYVMASGRLNFLIGAMFVNLSIFVHMFVIIAPLPLYVVAKSVSLYISKEASEQKLVANYSIEKNYDESANQSLYKIELDLRKPGGDFLTSPWPKEFSHLRFFGPETLETFDALSPIDLGMNVDWVKITSIDAQENIFGGALAVSRSRAEVKEILLSTRNSRINVSYYGAMRSPSEISDSNSNIIGRDYSRLGNMMLAATKTAYATYDMHDPFFYSYTMSEFYGNGGFDPYFDLDACYDGDVFPLNGPYGHPDFACKQPVHGATGVSYNLVSEFISRQKNLDIRLPISTMFISSVFMVSSLYLLGVLFLVASLTLKLVPAFGEALRPFSLYPFSSAGLVVGSLVSAIIWLS